MPEPAADSQATLALYVGGSESDPFVAECWAEAQQLVGDYIGSADVPASVVHRACLEVGSELYHRKNAPNGVASFATPDAAPIRVARDPMVGAYPILDRYVLGGLA